MIKIRFVEDAPEKFISGAFVRRDLREYDAVIVLRDSEKIDELILALYEKHQETTDERE